ncbi:hypothetical protein IF690_25105 [Pseudomonas sp. SK3(2021)]|nr:hypothetical protein IF690_25105 [Pseudomonas sp. SK3(2021)]
MAFAIGLCMALLHLWVFNVVDYGLEGANVESLSGKVLYADRGGMLIEDADSGEYTRLKVVRGITYLRSGHDPLRGQTLHFTYLRDVVLSCTLDGEELCIAQCANAVECLDSRREREAPQGMWVVAFGTSLVCLGLHALRRRKSASGSGIF